MSKCMQKLHAIWRIIWADKFAVFTLEDMVPEPGWLGAPNFFWNISHEDHTFFWYIKQRLKHIEENKETSSLDDLIRKY